MVIPVKLAVAISETDSQQMVWQHEESNEISRMNRPCSRNSDKPYRLTHRLSTFSVDNSGLKTGQIRAS
ncbi:hypothetical protein F3I27_18955 [Pantoea sp. Bo_2]|uniref:Uncharacterized protein n=1 Tax=Candidatus Pantoea gossypiicola TaxID=2608008 RepID=A0AB34CG73_9GAMM|nr:hypothetical protein F3I59_15940 [Pantoea sp. VH_8]KAA5931726.1 hypothetical protein F3I58_16535 [Pantoea sp. VH_4]KAA5940164.1 hypothetical protein F3I57_18115 [Pantoea sp. VH_3]KAA5948888.1 hypothetical protein F3I56_19015 [Pantoea sp. VH_25]KAA5952971.1 hypothetical protein F3I55_16605 [Pantoea sp. VH_24]KAA5956726.1 hypothetical protein F3I53_17855 [Pantoea sp. VH_16]KAA5962774.1 hypothetical protein F3I54_16895 [Pantoea sp. VH_18]KAA5978638.1 hypothetical protein F3I48_19130 [Pantoea